MVPYVRAVLCTVILLAHADGVLAQSGATTADLAGTVRDASAAVVPRAAITARQVTTNLTRTTETGDDGRFRIPALPPGAYSVTATAPGFAAQTYDPVILTLGSVLDVGFVLEIAGLETTVTVAARPPLLEPKRTAVAEVIPQTLIDSLPTNGRNYISFSLLTAGVNVDRTPQQGASATSGLTFAGQRARSNNITVDGLDNNDAAVGGVRAPFSQDAVQEFQVLANSFSAEFGKASGGLVNVVTRSGTNNRHGTVFYFLRDDALNAKEHFERFTPSGDAIDRAKAPYAQHQFGGTFGGPLARDRVFYFASVERLQVTANNFITIDDQTPISVFGRSFGTTTDILRAAGFPVDTGHVPYDVSTTTVLAKLDHHLRDGQDLSVRFNAGDTFNENVEPWGGLVAKSRGAAIDSRDLALAASLRSLGSARALNELRVQAAYRDQNVFALDPVCSGMCDRDDEGGPTLEIGGVAQVGRQRFTPQPRESIRYQVVDTFSYFHRNHGIKAGFDFSSTRTIASALPLHFGGRYIFAPLPQIPGVLPASISAVQALALGLPAAYVQGYGDPTASYTLRDLSVFAQDDWSLGRTLVLKGGLRYQKQFWPESLYTVPSVGTFEFPSDHNLAPRLALAWTPGGDSGRVSIHGAYGIFHDYQLTSFFGVGEILTGQADGVRTLVSRFPASAAAWNAPGRRLPEPSTFYPSLQYLPSADLATPFAHHVAVGVNAELAGRTSLSVNGVIAKGSDLVGALDYNPLIPALGAGVRPDDRIDPATGNRIPGTSTTVLQATSFGETWYRGLTVSITRRGPGPSRWLAAYTLSKAEDNSTDFQSTSVPQNMGFGRNPMDPRGLPLGFNPDDERGPSLQDQRHRLVVSMVWSLPQLFDVSAIASVGSGRPYNVLAGADLDGNGDAGNFPADRARVVPADPTTSVGRNSERLPAQATVDVRISRRVAIAGRATVEGSLDVFNLFNRANFTEINNVFGIGAYPTAPLPTFGQFLQAAPPRQIQLAARFTF